MTTRPLVRGLVRPLSLGVVNGLVRNPVNLIPNGDFDDDSGWSIGSASWEIAGGVATFLDSAPGAGAFLARALAATYPAGSYNFKVAAANVVVDPACSITVHLNGGAAITEIYLVRTNVTASVNVTVTGSFNQIVLTGKVGAETMTIDNLELYAL